MQIIGAMLILAAAVRLGLLCCGPVLRMTYLMLEAGQIALIQTIIDPARLNLGMVTLVLLGLCLLTKSLWDNLTSEM